MTHAFTTWLKPHRIARLALARTFAAIVSPICWAVWALTLLWEFLRGENEPDRNE